MEEKKNKGYYAIIPSYVRYDNDLPPNAKLLYGEITSLTNSKGYCWATNEYFASLYNVGKQSVSLWIKALVDKGYIESEIKYKGNTKEIKSRCLKIFNGGIVKNYDTPPLKNCKENNTYYNNTNNKEKEYKEKEVFSKEDLDLWFSKIYELYPRKTSKLKAREAFEHKVRGLTKDLAYKKSIRIYRLLEKQLLIWENEYRETKFLPYPASWLNANVEDSPNYKRGRK